MDPVTFITITFNVGGTIYEVSQSLLQYFPNTMLARAASETWSKKTNAKNDPIFMDRNGERFAFILDYMRDNKIVLPLTITKEALIDDLNYYGFDNIESIPISVNIPALELMKNSNLILDTYNEQIEEIQQNVKERTDNYNQKIATITQEFEDEVRDIKTEIRVMFFARDCFKRAMETEPSKRTFPQHHGIDYEIDKNFIKKHLKLFGLSWNGKFTGNAGLELNYYEK